MPRLDRELFRWSFWRASLLEETGPRLNGDTRLLEVDPLSRFTALPSTLFFPSEATARCRFIRIPPAVLIISFFPALDHRDNLGRSRLICANAHYLAIYFSSGRFAFISVVLIGPRSRHPPRHILADIDLSLCLISEIDFHFPRSETWQKNSLWLLRNVGIILSRRINRHSSAILRSQKSRSPEGFSGFHRWSILNTLRILSPAAVAS